MNATKELDTFVGYVADFYLITPSGTTEIYPIEGLTIEMIEAVCRVISLQEGYGGGDSVDRESARDLALDLFGLSFPTFLEINSTKRAVANALATGWEAPIR